MRIGIDYDGTFTADPDLFRGFIAAAMKSGHEVLCVTMRSPDEPIEMACEVVYTSREKKGFYMHRIGRPISLWIDDHPEFIY